jgi:hypothetical protein
VALILGLATAETYMLTSEPGGQKRHFAGRLQGRARDVAGRAPHRAIPGRCPSSPCDGGQGGGGGTHRGAATIGALTRSQAFR